MTRWDKIYLDLCENVLTNGFITNNRTGIKTYKLPHQILRFDLSEEFPILTTKYVAFKSAVFELLWFYQVQSNDVRWLQERNVTIWNEWQIDEDGFYQERDFGKNYAHTIGTAYGHVVSKYKLVENLINTLKTNPDDRRMVMSLWDNDLLKSAVLPSCVWNSQWDVTDGKLNCIVTQRSCDIALGLPFNVTQYATLVHMLAQVTNLKPGLLTWVINNAHIYENQIEGIKEQLLRKDEGIESPQLWLNPEITDFFEFDNSIELKDIKLINYKHQGRIDMPVAV